MSDSLKKKTAKGLGWSFIDNVSNQGITFLIGIILARLLTPEEYGLIGIILVFIAIFNSIVDSGFSSALIRKNDANETDYNTVFITNLILSLGLGALMFFSAGLVADFFGQGELVILTQVMSCVVIINAFSLVPRTKLTKEINFKIQTKISLISSISSGFVGVIFAYAGFGVWALVVQQILKQLLSTLFFWIYGKWRPMLEFSWQSFTDLFGFGWKLLVSGLIDSIWKELYQIVIGKVFSIFALGQYTRAKNFSDGVTYGILTIIQRVSYPSLSSIQEDDQRMKNVFKKLVKYTMLILFACILCMASVSKSLLYVLVGPQWGDAAIYLQLICFSLLPSPLFILNQNILQIKKKSSYVLWLNIGGKGLAFISIVLGLVYGIEAMLLTSAIVNICIVYPIYSYYSIGKFINYSVLEQIKDILPSLLIALIPALVVYSFNYIEMSDYLRLFNQLVLYCIIWIILCFISKNEEFLGVLYYAKSYVKFRKRKL